MMARSFWIVKPLINFSNIMHKHLQTTVHNISVTSTKTLRFDEIDDGLFNDYECISIDRCKQNWEHSHRNIYIRNSRKTRFLRRFQKSYFECTFFQTAFSRLCLSRSQSVHHSYYYTSQNTQPCLISPVVGTSKQRNTQ